MREMAVDLRSKLFPFFSRCDPKVSMAAYDDKSPLKTAIEGGRMEIWNIMREGLELLEAEKLDQLCRMIVAGKMNLDDPWKEFKELLSSLPVELVFIATYFFRTLYSWGLNYGTRSMSVSPTPC